MAQLVISGTDRQNNTGTVTVTLQTVPPVIVTNLEGLNAAILEAGPGGTVDIVGEFTRTKPYLINVGGASGNPVTIRGGKFRSNRTVPWIPGAVDGNPFFQLGAGADWLTFTDMIFENVGNGCFQLGAPAAGLTFDNIAVRNVQRFIENRILAGQTDATINGLTITGCVITAFSKGAIRLQYDTHNVHIGQTVGDSGIDGDNFAIGIHLTGTVHDVTCVEVTMTNCVQTRTPDVYWNADGFASEEDTHDLTFIDCSSSGCTDGGWDLKADRVHLLRCAASDNKRNFRFWGADVTLNVCVGSAPHKRGGTGTQTQIHATDTARVLIVGGLFTDCDPDTIVFDADQTSQISVLSAVVTHHPAGPVFTQETAAQVLIEDTTINLC